MALLMSSAFVRAGDGPCAEGAISWVRRYQWRTTAAAPETCGVACELPEISEYQVVSLKNLLQTPWGLATLKYPLCCGAAPVMWVPGATTSGFSRPSSVGPRLEKLMMSRALFACVSVTPHPSVPLWRTPSDAPTVITFLAEPSAEIVP